MEGFVSRLSEINAIADVSPGFVWRLKAEDRDATTIRLLENDLVHVNLSVWEDPFTLRDFAYRSPHKEMLRRRRDWFQATGELTLVLWWIPAGQRPTVAEGMARLERLRREGPGPEAFTFFKLFGPPNDRGKETTG
jgi:Domain of unknown function (DUF3291)